MTFTNLFQNDQYWKEDDFFFMLTLHIFCLILPTTSCKMESERGSVLGRPRGQAHIGNKLAGPSWDPAVTDCISAPSLPYYTVYTPQFTLYTKHNTLYNPQFTLNITKYTTHNLRFTLNITNYIPQFTLYTKHNKL